MPLIRRCGEFIFLKLYFSFSFIRYYFRRKNCTAKINTILTTINNT